MMTWTISDLLPGGARALSRLDAKFLAGFYTKRGAQGRGEEADTKKGGPRGPPWLTPRKKRAQYKLPSWPFHLPPS
jgi:hypothetical protein